MTTASAPTRRLTSDQRSAFAASLLGWMMDAFDYFIVVLVYADIAAEFHVTLEQIAFGPYVYHLERGELRQGEEAIRLTDRERDMLRILALARGETVPRNALTGDGTVNERAVDVQINRLRRKIERDPANPLFLQAVRGIGYRLVASP